MKIIHMMMGIPGSGKTYYAKQLSQELNCPLVSITILRNVRLDWEKVDLLHESYRLSAEFLKTNDEIVYDARNITKTEREDFIKAVKDQGLDFDLYGYYIKAPLETCIERIIHRNDIASERYYSPEKVRITYDKFEVPKPGEFTKLNIIEN